MIALELLVVCTMLAACALSLRQCVLACVVAGGREPVAHDASRAEAETLGAAAAPAPLPTVAVLIAAHNEEKVIEGCLRAMLALDYPSGLLSIVVINDRSADRTGEIADRIAAADPRVRVLHRRGDARPGKSSAIADAMQQVDSEILVLFDADYLPLPGLLKQLVAPFSDPRVGASMGRVVPYNADSNLLTRLLDLERRAGYAVDQHGRAISDLVPQFGGTVGGIRASALHAVGGWREGHMTEDTDLTFRLVLGGWKIAYLNRSACYEEVPESWVSRFKQVRRWSYGHNECLLSYFLPVLTSRFLTLHQKIDAVMILLFYLFPALTLASTFALVLLLAYGPPDGLVCYACNYLGPILAVAVISPALQAVIAVTQDGQRHVVRQLPLLFVSSTLSMLAAISGIAQLAHNRAFGRTMVWDKTQRFRAAA